MNVTRNLLTIISITKNDLNGIRKTITSTRELRSYYDVKQLIIDSSERQVASDVMALSVNEVNLRYISFDQNGISKAFNEGIRCASSDWIWFLNGGDIILPECTGGDYANFIYLLNKTTADLVVYQIKFSKSHRIFSQNPLKDNWPIIHSRMPHPSTIIRYKLFKLYGMYNKKYKIAIDLEFWSRISNKNINVNYISIPIISFHENGISFKNIVPTRKEQKRISKKYLISNIRKLLGKMKIVIESSF